MDKIQKVKEEGLSWQLLTVKRLPNVHLFISLSPGKQICLCFAEFTRISTVWGCEGLLHLQLQLGDMYPMSKISQAELIPVLASANAVLLEI